MHYAVFFAPYWNATRYIVVNSKYPLKALNPILHFTLREKCRIINCILYIQSVQGDYDYLHAQKPINACKQVNNEIIMFYMHASIQYQIYSNPKK